MTAGTFAGNIIFCCGFVRFSASWERKECKPNSLPVLPKFHVKVGDTVKLILDRFTKIFKHEINLKTEHVMSREEGGTIDIAGSSLDIPTVDLVIN
ncbi:50S ribosomal protein L24, putative [Medicago truncatula]|uniref:50S ribosomal protein L24, putative n=1 Tax=Medicago truncatula TaxID=3880 RepID=G7IHB4_MEDTR|nr:50S ribosomal protein L24, putative [Medicago truncatula]